MSLEESLENRCSDIVNEKEDRATGEILQKILERISTKYDELYPRDMFGYWTSGDARFSFSYIYEDAYKKEFQNFVNEKDKEVFYFMAINIEFFLNIIPWSNKSKLLKEVKKFVSSQIEDTGNWCNVRSKMYEYLIEHNGELLIVEENPT
jgi:hypothetical protein